MKAEENYYILFLFSISFSCHNVFVTMLNYGGVLGNKDLFNVVVLRLNKRQTIKSKYKKTILFYLYFNL